MSDANGTGPPAADAAAAHFTARFEPGGAVFPVPAGGSLLQAAERAGIALPSSCRNGTCRTCMCRLLSGTVRYHIEWPGLLAEEKAEGWILPCIARAQSDVVLTWPGARGLPKDVQSLPAV
jgi:ferredoxin